MPVRVAAGTVTWRSPLRGVRQLSQRTLRTAPLSAPPALGIAAMDLALPDPTPLLARAELALCSAQRRTHSWVLRNTCAARCADEELAQCAAMPWEVREEDVDAAQLLQCASECGVAAAAPPIDLDDARARCARACAASRCRRSPSQSPPDM